MNYSGLNVKVEVTVLSIDFELFRIGLSIPSTSVCHASIIFTSYLVVVIYKTEMYSLLKDAISIIWMRRNHIIQSKLCERYCQ